MEQSICNLNFKSTTYFMANNFIFPDLKKNQAKIMRISLPKKQKYVKLLVISSLF